MAKICFGLPFIVALIDEIKELKNEVNSTSARGIINLIAFLCALSITGCVDSVSRTDRFGPSTNMQFAIGHEERYYPKDRTGRT